MGVNRYPGNIVTANQNPPTIESASGVWTVTEALQNIGNWPMAQTQVANSLRFNSADSAYLSRTPASAGNKKTWTWSGWVKRTNPGAQNAIFSAGTSFGTNNNDLETISFPASDTLEIASEVGGATQYRLITTQLFRDPSAWYHIVVAVDTTQATASNRIKLYINGSQVTAFGTSTYPPQNYACWTNSTNAHRIGSRVSPDFNGYQTEINFIDGQALDPDYFGFFDANGIWQPRDYKGTYGTNGFYTNFSDNSNTTAATLGKDYSGNGNNWTPNNFSVTAGSGNDSLVDTPTNYGTDTGVGGEVRGNYATLNPLDKNAAVTTVNGNLSYTSSNDRIVKATIGVTTGKWYWEFAPGGGGSTSGCGVINPSVNIHATVNLNIATAGVSYLGNGNKSVNGTASSYGATYTSGDIIGVALNLDSNSVTFYKNNTSQGSISLTSGLEWFPAFDQNTGTNFVNFGQRPFAYTAPSGFKALCTQNLPEPTVADGGEYFNALLWTGDGTAPKSFTGVGFQPDLVWIKARNTTYWHQLTDAVRGVNKALFSNATDAETTTNAVSAFGTDGFTINTTDVNGSGVTYVAWNWKANGAGVSNTAGTISSTVSANTTAGFSVVTYTGNGTSGATVGHGLSAQPSMIIVKSRSAGSTDWIVYHVSLGATKNVRLNTTAAEAIQTVMWNDTSPTSSVFSLGNNNNVNTNTQTQVAYCFAPIAGYSAFGSYAGNGSTDGPFVFTGFRPRYVLIKKTGAAQDWFVYDTARDTYNVANKTLFPNASYAEESTRPVDILSNGFKLRIATATNDSGATYAYACFAENPFKIARAR